jgi:L-asparagine oxygenase
VSVAVIRSTGEGPVKVFTLPDSIRDEIYNEVSNLKVDTSSLEDLSSFIEEVKEIVQSHAPPEFLSALRSLHDATSPTSAVYIRNLPVDPHVPPTPTDGSLSLGKTTYVAEAMLVGFGELTKSHVVGYSAETQYSNPWIHEGFPRTSKGSALTKASDLSFHQDMSYHPQPPDVLGLVCVREGHDKNVNTELVDNREVFELLPDEVIELLRESRFQIKTSAWVDASWDVGNNGRGILSHDSSIALPVDWENMVGLDEEAQAAVELLKEAILAAPKHFVHFVPGDLLLFANRRTVHARTPYADLRFDGGDRVLDRSYFRKELSSEQRRTRLI